MDAVLRTRVVRKVHAVSRGHLLARANLERLETGTGTEADIDKLLDISDTIFGKSFCALGDGAASPILSSIKFFRDEYLSHLGEGCPFDPHASTLMAAEEAGV